ncbi:MAG TPA: serine hydrolase domain-containing protein [Nevskiaceae bacterium]|nr:serine hydrolase domain-containing protein [Nevskiaceae bacterium]
MTLTALLPGRWIPVPSRLEPLIQIDHAAEVAPAEVGLPAARVQAIWQATERLYRTGIHPAISLTLRHRGQRVLKRTIGALSGNGPGEQGPVVPLPVDAPLCLFSASKAITGLLLHKQVELGRLRLDDPVAEYLPAFATHGKGRVTLRQLMAHRAGIPQLPLRHPDPTLLRHWDAVVDLLCATPPLDPRFEKQAYHAITAGFIVGEVVQRVSGLSLREALDQYLARPLGLKTLSYGLPAARRAGSPRNHRTGPTPFWPLTRLAEHALGVSFDRATEVSNEDGFLSAVVPAGNLYASADEACMIFQMLLNGGELDGVRVFQPETVADALRPIGRIQSDGMLLVPIRFSAGFMLGEDPVGLYGPRCGSAFGHLGFINILCWADPRRDLSVALLNTGKSMSPAGLYRLARLLGEIGQIGR